MNIGVIGYGDRMQHLLNLLKKYPKIKIIKIFDPKKASQNRARKEFPHTTLTASYKDITQDPDIDWVCIGSPNQAHFEQLIAALNAQKHIFIEKPIVTTIEQAIKLYQVTKITSSNIFIGYTLRYAPHYQKIKEILDSKVMGNIVSIEANETITPEHGARIMTDWRSSQEKSGGHMLEKCSHDIDMMQYLLKEYPQKAASFGKINAFTKNNSELFPLIHKRATTYPVKTNPYTAPKSIIDHQVAILEFPSGITATFHTNTHTPLRERRLYICGTKATLRANLIQGIIELKRIDKRKTLSLRHKFTGGHGKGDSRQMHKLYQTMQGKETCNHATEAITSAITALAIDEARIKNKIVNLSDYWKKLR